VLVACGQLVAIGTYLRLNRLEAQLVSAQPRLAIGMVLTFGMAGLLPWTSLGRALTAAEPTLVPGYRRRIALGVGVTFAGVLVAFATFLANA
jgi:hypothetical protein